MRNTGKHLLNETIIFLQDVPRLMPRTPRGRPIHLCTVVRWKDRGLRGVKLEAVRLGGRWVTSREALERFVARLTSASRDGAGETGEPVHRRAERAEEALKKEGIW